MLLLFLFLLQFSVILYFHNKKNHTIIITSCSKFLLTYISILTCHANTTIFCLSLTSILLIHNDFNFVVVFLTYFFFLAPFHLFLHKNSHTSSNLLVFILFSWQYTFCCLSLFDKKSFAICLVECCSVCMWIFAIVYVY